MRLPKQVVVSLTQAVQDCFGPDAQVWLFGSRVDDTKRGGDIDLYVETSIEDTVSAKLEFRNKLESILGEQKIDVIVHQISLPLQPIHQIAKKTGILLSL